MLLTGAGLGAPGGGGATWANQSSYIIPYGTSGPTYTVGSIPIGTATSTRQVVVAIAAAALGTYSVTVNSISLTQVSGSNTFDGSTGWSCATFSGNITSSTTASVAITTTGSHFFGGGFIVGVLDNLNSATAGSATYGDYTSGTGPYAAVGSITISSGGWGIATAGFSGTATPSISWTTLSQDTSATDAGDGIEISEASTKSAGSLTPTVSSIGTSVNAGACMTAAAWR